MADLLGTTFAANYRKTASGSNFGTPTLGFIKVVISGGSPPDLSSSPGASNSDFHKAVNALQGFVELYMIGAPSSTAFVAAIHDNTKQDSDTSTNVAGGYGDAEAAIYAALGSWGSGVVTITALTATGASIA